MGPKVRAYERYIAGSERVETPAGILTLRRVVATDLPILLAWRSDPEITRYLPTSREELLTWADQAKWYKTVGITDYWTATMSHSREWGPRPIGLAHWHAKTGEIGLLIGEKTLWHQGVGRAVLSLALRNATILCQPLVMSDVWAVIHPENEASLRLFETLGFIPGWRPGDDEGRSGQLVYRWNEER